MHDLGTCLTLESFWVHMMEIYIIIKKRQIRTPVPDKKSPSPPNIGNKYLVKASSISEAMVESFLAVF